LKFSEEISLGFQSQAYTESVIVKFTSYPSALLLEDGGKFPVPALYQIGVIFGTISHKAENQLVRSLGCVVSRL
jgi:hypothetical protein